jgi:hypothetical protein
MVSVHPGEDMTDEQLDQVYAAAGLLVACR